MRFAAIATVSLLPAVSLLPRTLEAQAAQADWANSAEVPIVGPSVTAFLKGYAVERRLATRSAMLAKLAGPDTEAFQKRLNARAECIGIVGKSPAYADVRRMTSMTESELSRMQRRTDSLFLSRCGPDPEVPTSMQDANRAVAELKNAPAIAAGLQPSQYELLRFRIVTWVNTRDPSHIDHNNHGVSPAEALVLGSRIAELKAAIPPASK